MLNILVGSNTAGMLLLKILEPENTAGLVKFRFAQPMSSLYSAAKTLLEVRNEPVAVVLDADSTVHSMADRVRQEAQEVIGDSANGAPLRIIVAVPAVEALLFRIPDAVKRAYGNTTRELIELGLVSPGDALRKMQGAPDRYHASSTIVINLNVGDCKTLRSEPPVRELLEFLDELQLSDAQTLGVSSP